MSEMSTRESWERVSEGLKKCVSRSKELALAQKNTQWDDIARSFEGILKSAAKMYESRALTRAEVVKMTDEISKTIKAE